MLFKEKKKKIEEQQKLENKEKELAEKKNKEKMVNNNSTNVNDGPVTVTVKVKPKFGTVENKIDEEKVKLTNFRIYSQNIKRTILFCNMLLSYYYHCVGRIDLKLTILFIISSQ